jgi:hypothetical protein
MGVLLLTEFANQQILDHMNESAVYSEADLAPFHRRLAELRKIVQNDTQSGKHPEAMTTLLDRQLTELGVWHKYLKRREQSLILLSF